MTVTNQVASMSVPTLGQKCLAIVGATGMVGGYALRYALENPTVGRVTAIGRKKVGISHPKLKEVLHQDFADCAALAETLLVQDAADLLPWARVYRGGLGRGPPRDYRGLRGRVRASVPRQQPRRDVLVLEREWRGPDGTKSSALRTLQGRRPRSALLLAAGFPRVYIFRPAVPSTPWSRGRNRISLPTACCARSTLCFGRCPLTR